VNDARLEWLLSNVDALSDDFQLLAREVVRLRALAATAVAREVGTDGLIVQDGLLERTATLGR
jgi:hypothetical protein